MRLVCSRYGCLFVLPQTRPLTGFRNCCLMSNICRSVYVHGESHCTSLQIVQLLLRKYTVYDFVQSCVLHSFILLSITNKMQRYTIFFITVNAVHVSGGQNCTHSIWYMSSLFAATASRGELRFALALLFRLLRWSALRWGYSCNWRASEVWNGDNYGVHNCTIWYSPGRGGGRNKSLNEDSNLVEIWIRYFPNRSGQPYRTISCLVCLSDGSGNM
jgi:hypothetical protein